MKNILEILKERIILKDSINIDSFIFSNEKNQKSLYIGVDPTGSSLHIGHYLLFNIAKIFSDHNVKIYFVLGGFTAAIGDPSGKNSERKVIEINEIENNRKKIENQLIEFSKTHNIKNISILNNLDHYKNMSIVELYQKFGKHFNLNSMLSREMVSSRLETGISYTEFSYQIFQGIDFYILNKNHEITLQIGGSDQFGNIVSGVELIRKMSGKEVSGLTTNLITDSSGNKIGKTSEGKVIWLNKNMISSYDYWQYFINIDDESAKKFLRQLTLIDISKIIKLEQEHLSIPKEKILQKELIKYLLEKIWNENEFEKVEKNSKLIFQENYYDLEKNILENLLKNIPLLTKVEKSNEDKTLREILIDKNICSRKEFEDFIKQGALKINGLKLENPTIKLNALSFLHDKFSIISIGKKNKQLISK